MKRLTLALAAIGLATSCSAFAAYPANTDPTMIAVPQLPGGLVFGLTGIYMQPSASSGDLDWAILVTTGGGGIENPPTTNNIQQIDPGWSFGGGGNIGYIFPGTGNDINLSYLHLNTNDTDTLSTPAFNLAAPTIQTIDPINSFGALYQLGSSTTKYSLDQIDLTFGQFINVGCRLVLHPFAGARFANITRDLNSNYNGNFTIALTTESDVESVDESSSFTGVGPLAGMDASYYIWNGIGAVGHFDTGLLIGNINSSINDTLIRTITDTEGTTTDSLIANINADNTTRIVPVIDAALGLDYTWLFNNANNSDLTLEVGYKVTNYFNAIDRVYLVTNNHNSSDLAISGVYATLTLHI